jgi:RES domain-containing protein
MVYTAQSKSLAILEVLVHIQKVGVLSSYSLIAARFDENLVERLDPSRLPERWRDYPVPAGLRAIGDAWIESRTSAVLEVTSTIVEDESNYLINPDHPDFASAAMGHPEPFEFDPRLLG